MVACNCLPRPVADLARALSAADHPRLVQALTETTHTRSLQGRPLMQRPSTEVALAAALRRDEALPHSRCSISQGTRYAIPTTLAGHATGGRAVPDILMI